MQVKQLIGDFQPVRLPQDSTVLVAVNQMVKCRCGSVLVLDDQGHMAGIFTERDLMTRVISKGKQPAEVLLSEVLTRDVYSVHPDEKVADVRRELRQRHIRHVPVKDGDEILAVLSMRDLLNADFQAQRESAKAMETYIRGEI